VRVGNAVTYEGSARVVRIEGHHRKERVALQLLTGFLDLPGMQRQALEIGVREAFEQGPEAVREHLPAAFREVVEKIAHFLNYYRLTLDDCEARMRAVGPVSEEDIMVLAQRGADSMRDRWNRFRIEATEVAAACIQSPEVRKLAQRYALSMTSSNTHLAPNFRQSLDKPLGYPGDYRVMLDMYEPGYRGDSAFARAFHKLGCEEPLGAAVCTRKDLLLDLQREEMERYARAGHKGPFRATSLACGPCREVSEFVSKQDAWPCPAEWVLIDQEEEALSLAWREIHHAMALHPAPVQIHCLHLSFGQILRSPDVWGQDGEQDLIYAAGMMDYLPAPLAAQVLRAFYRHLRPGGLLAFANARQGAPSFVLEYLADWTLLYRSPQDLLGLARAVEGARPSLRTETTGMYDFLLLRRP
jgi:SAM-dependent methyltransferase